MRSNWFIVVIFASFFTFERASCRPDFGVPAIVLDSGLVNVNANLIRDSMNEVLNMIRRMPSNLHSETLRKAADSLSMLALNVTEKGTNLATNFSKAAMERTVPVEDLFRSLYLSFGEMGQLLTDDGPVFVKQLNEMFGNVTANEFERALEGMNSSLMDTLRAAINLELAMNNSLKELTSIPVVLGVPITWSHELSKALLKLRDQVRLFSKAVDASVKSIEVSNSNLNFVDTNIRTVDSGLQFALSMFYSTMEYQFSSAVNKYQSAQKNFQSDFAAATQRLKIFSSDKTLNGLSDLHAEEFTKHYYKLHNRNASDMAVFYHTFDWIRSNASDVLEEAGQLFSGAVNSSAVSLVSMILARERFAEQCNGKFSSRLTNSFAGFQSKSTNCLNRERGRISKISDVIDQVLLLMQSSSVDFSSDVGSCSRFGAFTSNEVDYLQAKACLEANLREINSYNQLMNAQLDSLKPVLYAEAEASQFRTRQCIKQTVNEMSAPLHDVKTGVLNCAVNGP